MSDIVTSLIETLNTHPELGGIATFLISAGESIAILGTLVPGSITMTAIGALAGAGIIPLWSTLLWATLGAVVGDGISYWIGHHFKDRLHRLWPFRTHPTLLKTGEIFFRRHGSLSVFIGRFVGPVRALVPLVAGMLGMRPTMFYLANITSAILWAPAYMLPGILLGAASLELPHDIAMHVMMVFILIVLIALMILWFIYKIFQLIQKQTDQLKNYIWRHLKQSRYFSLVTATLKHHDSKKTHGQLRLALYFLIVVCLFSTLILVIKIKGPADLMINDAVFHFFRGIRTPQVDNIMIALTLLGQKEVVLPAVFILFIYLLFSKRVWTGLHVLLLGFLGAGSIFVIKHFVHSPRPWGITEQAGLELYSFPSGHTTFATLALLGFAFLIATSFKPKHRFPFYVAACCIAFAVGISRLYLGAHWFTDILAGWFLGVAILIVVIISFRRHAEKPINPLGTFVVSVIAVGLSLSGYLYFKKEQIMLDYQQVSWPRAEIAETEWWQKNNAIPAYRVSLFGFPSQAINIEWVGDLNDIKDVLMQQGWNKPPARNWVSTVHRIADISSSEYLPMVSPQYLDNRPALILTREISNGTNPKNLLVLRLWDSYRTIKSNHKTLWVGVISIVPSTYSWLYRDQPEDITGNANMIFPENLNQHQWQWKLIHMNQPTGTKNSIRQTIILIRNKK